MSATSFFVAGIPQPQGSKTAYVVKGRAVIVDKNPTLLKPWRKAIAVVAKSTWVHRSPLAGPVRLYVGFVFERPASVKRDYPHVRPDLDKLLRALMDGITDAGVVWGDDSQVVEIETSKVYGDAPGAHVVISAVGAPVPQVSASADAASQGGGLAPAGMKG